jgi:hypothetical protein
VEGAPVAKVLGQASSLAAIFQSAGKGVEHVQRLQLLASPGTGRLSFINSIYSIISSLFWPVSLNCFV